MIQKLTYKTEVYFIGISEIQNANQLNTDELLALAKSYADEVLAIQFFNSSMIVNELHLLSAAQNAINAWRGNYMISRNLDVEIIVYASTQRQIHEALSMLGVIDDLPSISAIIIDTDETKVNQTVQEVIRTVGNEIQHSFCPSKEKIATIMKTFNIAESELRCFMESDDIKAKNKALAKCVTSRVSLVALGT